MTPLPISHFPDGTLGWLKTFHSTVDTRARSLGGQFYYVTYYNVMFIDSCLSHSRDIKSYAHWTGVAQMIHCLKTKWNQVF